MLSRKLLIVFLKPVLMKAIFLILGMTFVMDSFAQTDTLMSQKVEVVLAGKTQGLLPFLKFGPGTDRLGGAKMTYLDTAVILQVIDSLKDDYIVRLSRNHQAFIQKENVRLITAVRRPDYSLTASWRVSGDEKQDYVAISLGDRLPYQSIQLIDQSSIVVDN